MLVWRMVQSFAPAMQGNTKSTSVFVVLFDKQQRHLAFDQWN